MTTIEWTRGDDGSLGKTWNPTRGCALVSPGCTNCYAMKFAHLFSGDGQPYDGLTKMRTKGGPVWTGVVRASPEHIVGMPLTWHAPRRVFVDSMSDLFHEDVPVEHVAMVFGVMALSGHHTFQILTKRAERMRDVVSKLSLDLCLDALTRFSTIAPTREAGRAMKAAMIEMGRNPDNETWPLPHVWLGVSVENQDYADARIPDLLRTPAAIRFVSAEPLLDEVNLSRYLEAGSVCECPSEAYTGERCEGKGPRGWIRCNAGLRHLDWVIVGGESGPGSRPFSLEWAEAIRRDCAATDTPLFMKQLGNKPFEQVDGEGGLDSTRVHLEDPKGGDWDEWPWKRLRVRQFPKETAA